MEMRQENSSDKSPLESLKELENMLYLDRNQNCLNPFYQEIGLIINPAAIQNLFTTMSQLEEHQQVE